MTSACSHPWFRWCGLFAAWCLLLLTGCGSVNKNLALPKMGGPIPVSGEREPTAAERAYWEQLAPARVIYVSETHNSNADHVYQWEVLKGLRSRGNQLTVGWEMFDRTQQGFLDAWNARHLTTDALLAKTNFQPHWGTYSVMYEKILRWTQTEGIASLALNAPANLSHKLAQGEPLDPDERALVPADFQPLPGGYEHFTSQMGENPHGGADLRKFYAAQLLWDQTMASRIVDFLASHPDGKLVVLLGRGHVEGGFGVPAFVSQKTNAPQLVVFPSGLPTENPAAPPGKLARAGAKTSDRLSWNVRFIQERASDSLLRHARAQTR